MVNNMNIKSKFLVIKRCEFCESDFELRHRNRLKNKHFFCSRECYDSFKIKNKKPPNFECSFCKKEIRKKPSEIKKSKYLYCSMNCKNKHDSILMSGENNHQYGVKGKLNSSWISDIRISSHGYRKIRCENHPLRDCDDFVLEHRLVAEKYLLEDFCSIEIDGKMYLSKDYDVHHKDSNKLNNNPENLQILTRSEHMSLHQAIRKGGIGSTNSNSTN